MNKRTSVIRSEMLRDQERYPGGSKRSLPGGCDQTGGTRKRLFKRVGHSLM